MIKYYQFAKALYLFFVISALILSCNKKDQNISSAFIAPKQIFASVNTSRGLLIIMDYNTNIVKQKDFGLPAINFQRWVFNDQIRYSYLEVDTTGALQRVSYPGSVVITDTNFNELKRIRLLPYAGHNDLMYPVDGHDFILIDDDHYIVQAYYEKRVNNIPNNLNPVVGCKVVAPIIQEVQFGKVIWEWDGTNYPEFYNTSIQGNNFSDSTVSHDYMHLNSMFIDPRDNKLICSFRNMDQVLKINRVTGVITWRLGGKNSDFPLSANQKSMRQHNATLTDNNQVLLVYDNGDVTLRPYTRILEYKLDESNKIVKDFKAFTVRFFSAFRRSVQKTDSSYFIGTGDVKFMEINYNTGKIILDKDLPTISYRVVRY